MASRPGAFDDGIGANLGYVRRAVESIWSRSAERGLRWSGTFLLDGRIGYLAPDDFLAELREELGMPSPTSMAVWFWQKGPAKRVLWVANIWCDPMRIPIASIGDAGKKLRVISAKPIVFGAEAPKAPLGSWTLIDADTILASPHCSSPFPKRRAICRRPCGAAEPRPSQALELFTILGERPIRLGVR